MHEAMTEARYISVEGFVTALRSIKAAHRLYPRYKLLSGRRINKAYVHVSRGSAEMVYYL